MNAIEQARALKARQDAEVERRLKWAGLREQVDGMTDSEVYIANEVLASLLSESKAYTFAADPPQMSDAPPPSLPEPPSEVPQRPPVHREHVGWL